VWGGGGGHGVCVFYMLFILHLLLALPLGVTTIVVLISLLNLYALYAFRSLLRTDRVSVMGK